MRPRALRRVSSCRLFDYTLSPYCLFSRLPAVRCTSALLGIIFHQRTPFCLHKRAPKCANFPRKRPILAISGRRSENALLAFRFFISDYIPPEQLWTFRIPVYGNSLQLNCYMNLHHFRLTTSDGFLYV